MSVASKARVLVTACHGVSELRTVRVFWREFSWDCAVIARAHALFRPIAVTVFKLAILLGIREIRTFWMGWHFLYLDGAIVARSPAASLCIILRICEAFHSVTIVPCISESRAFGMHWAQFNWFFAIIAGSFALYVSVVFPSVTVFQMTISSNVGEVSTIRMGFQRFDRHRTVIASCFTLSFNVMFPFSKAFHSVTIVPCICELGAVRMYWTKFNWFFAIIAGSFAFCVSVVFPFVTVFQ